MAGSVGVLNVMWAGQTQKSIVRKGKKFFLLQKFEADTGGPQTLLFIPYRALFPPDVKQPEHGTDH